MIKTKKAFTLIEVIVALAIISIALFAITQSISESVKTQLYLKQNLTQYLKEDNAQNSFKN